MKTLLQVALIGFLVVLFAENSFAEDYNFRKTKWGMSITQVKFSEPLEVVKEDKDFLAYKTTVIGKDVFVVYFFVDNKLVRAKYVLDESHTNKNDFITDYNDFKEILTKKYGKPKQDDILWKNDLYKDDYSYWGTAKSIKAMLEQKKKGLKRYIPFSYSVDGKKYSSPENKNDLLKELEQDIENLKKDLTKAEKESEQYGSGILGVLSLTQVATVKNSIAFLEQKRLLLKHDIPYYSILPATSKSNEPSFKPTPGKDIDKF